MDADPDLFLLCEGSAMESIGATMVWELMKTIKEVSNRGEFDKIKDSLLELENTMKVEFDNLRKKCDSLERSRNLIEFQKLICEEKLEIFQSENQNVKEKAMVRLMDRELGCFNKVDEKNEILGLKKEISKLKEQVLEYGKVGKLYFGKFTSIKLEVTEMEKEFRGLKSEKFLADQIGEKLRRQNVGYGETLEQFRTEKSRVDEELRLQKFEASKIVEELAQQKMEASQMEEELKRQVLEADIEKKKSDKKLDEMMNCKMSEIDCLNVKLQEMEGDNKKLKVENLLAEDSLRKQVLAAEIQKHMLDATIREIGTAKLRLDDKLRRKSLESSQIIGELRREKFETSQIAEELKRKMLEAADMERRKTDEIIQEMSRNKLEVDCLKRKQHELESEIERLKVVEFQDSQTIEQMRCEKFEASHMVVELNNQLLEAAIEKKKSNETIDEMMSKVMEIDCLNAMLSEIQSQIKRLKADKLLDSRCIEEMAQQILEVSQMEAALKTQLSEAADVAKRKSDETKKEMNTRKLVVDSLNTKLQEKESEIEEFKAEKMSDVRTNEEMRLQITKASQVEEDLNRKLRDTADMLKRKSDETSEEMKSKQLEFDCITEKLQNAESEIERLKKANSLGCQHNLKALHSIEELKFQKMEASKMVEDLNGQLKVAEYTTNEVRRINVEDYHIIQDLRFRESEALKKVEELRSKVEDMRQKLMTTECTITKLRQMNLEDYETIQQLREVKSGRLLVLDQDGGNSIQLCTVEAIPYGCYDPNLPKIEANDDGLCIQLQPTASRKLLLLGSKDNNEQSDIIVINDSDYETKTSGLASTQSSRGKEKMKCVQSLSHQMISPCTSSALKRKRNSLGEDEGSHKRMFIKRE